MRAFARIFRCSHSTFTLFLVQDVHVGKVSVVTAETDAWSCGSQVDYSGLLCGWKTGKLCRPRGDVDAGGAVDRDGDVAARCACGASVRRVELPAVPAAGSWTCDFQLC